MSYTTIRFHEQAKPGFVSVIIPVDGDVDGLRLTLHSLTKQTFPPKQFEILVGNDGGTPAITRLCKEFLVTMLSSPTTIGSYAMRNLIIERSRGEIVAFIDAQTQASPTWLSDGVLAMKNASYVGGVIDVIPDPLRLISRKLLIYQQTMTFDVAEYMNAFHFASTTNLFVSRKLLMRVGGFDRRLLSSGDLEFGKRAIDDFQASYTYDPRVQVRHLTRSFWALTTKQRRIAHGHFALSLYYPGRFKQFRLSLLALLLRLFIPPIWIFSRKRMLHLDYLERLWVFGIHCWMNNAYLLFRIEALLLRKI